jgi:hypothetical protein
MQGRKVKKIREHNPGTKISKSGNKNYKNMGMKLQKSGNKS